MKIIIHRVNKIEELENVPHEYGVEVDVRGFGEKLLLTHDPITADGHYDELEGYLGHYKHSFIVFNVKETGYEDRVIALAEKYGITEYFLLDVEFPYLYRASRKNKFKKIAVRYSEAEPIEFVEAQIENGEPLVSWVWIDTNTRLPLSENIIKRLAPFKTCLVSPDRWGRPQDIATYGDALSKLKFQPDAVMTTLKLAQIWENAFAK